VEESLEEYSFLSYEQRFLQRWSIKSRAAGKRVVVGDSAESSVLVGMAVGIIVSSIVPQLIVHWKKKFLMGVVMGVV